MARKKLFGNASEPRCETCLQGRRSSDGNSVLCQRGGVLPLSHHCRHFQYDPLRRTPRRVRPLEEFDAAEFALDDVSAEWLEAVSEEQPSPEDVRHNELMKKLRTYLTQTATPNVDDILVLLNETPVTSGDTAALLAEADALVDDSIPADIQDDTPDDIDADISVPADLDDLLSFEGLTPPQDDTVAEDTATPEEKEEETAVWHADNEPDIEGDLERLTVDVVQSSTPAAFRHFDLKLGPTEQTEERDDIRIAETFSDTALLTVPSGNDADDSESLRAEDLIFLSESQLFDEDTDEIAMNADGTFTQVKDSNS